MEIEEVFEARITSGRQMRSRSRNSSDLISNFSVAASTMKSQSVNLARSTWLNALQRLGSLCSR